MNFVEKYRFRSKVTAALRQMGVSGSVERLFGKRQILAFGEACRKKGLDPIVTAVLTFKKFMVSHIPTQPDILEPVSHLGNTQILDWLQNGIIDSSLADDALNAILKAFIPNFAAH